MREKISALAAQVSQLERQAQEAQAACAGLNLQDLEQAILQKQREYGSAEKAAAQLLKEAQEGDAQRERAKTALVLSAGLGKGSGPVGGLSHPLGGAAAAGASPGTCQALRREALSRREELGKAASSLQALGASLDHAAQLEQRLSGLEEQLSQVAKLSKLLSGSNPMKMPILQYVLSVMLDEVLVSANRFFSTLSRGRTPCG